MHRKLAIASAVIAVSLTRVDGSGNVFSSEEALLVEARKKQEEANAALVLKLNAEIKD